MEDNTAKIEHFMRLFERVGCITVSLNSKQKELEDLRKIILNLSDLYPTCIINLQKYNQHLLVLKNDLNCLYTEYVLVNKQFLKFIETEDEKTIYSCVIRATKKEEELKKEIVKDRALGISDDNIEYICNLADVYYQYIESIHFILDERNDLKQRSKTPR